MSEHSELEALTFALRKAVLRRTALGARMTRAVPRGSGAPPIAPAAAQTAPQPPRPSQAAAPAPPVEEPRQPRPARPAEPRAPVRPAPEPSLTPDRLPTTAIAAGCADLAALRGAVAACTACELSATRTQTVFQDGSGPARVMFIGEAPGFYEDQQGVPFVGPAGQLLSDIIQKGMGLTRSDVVIANVLKCRPPDNRDPTQREKELCTPFLDRQIELIDPEVLIPLGRHAACHVLGIDAPMGRLRGRVHEARGRKVVATYHPAYLLRSPGMKPKCWEDIQLAMKLLGLEPPKRGA